jgi:hypothetical protein
MIQIIADLVPVNEPILTSLTSHSVGFGVMEVQQRWEREDHGVGAFPIILRFLKGTGFIGRSSQVHVPALLRVTFLSACHKFASRFSLLPRR